MSEEKENPKASKRSKRKAPMEPLGWDEIVSQPGMGGYLSFLNGPVPLPHLVPPNTGGAANAGGDANPGVGLATEGAIGQGVDTVTGGVTTAEGRADTGYDSSTGVDSGCADDSTTGPNLAPEAATRRGGESGAGSVATAEGAIGTVDGSIPGVDLAAEAVKRRHLATTVRVPLPGGDADTGVDLVAPAPRVRIRRCFGAQDGHSLGEEVLYQALWKAAVPESGGDARTIVIGWRGMSQICRMTPKNCKINTQRLIRKLALEILSPYNTPESIGTTYRVHSAESIVRRRRAAGLEWVVRSRGVEFVNPATGTVMPMCAVT